jgi:large subunit ribosomal protein L24
LIDPKSGKATRAGYKVDKDGNKTRIACRSGEAV